MHQNFKNALLPAPHPWIPFPISWPHRAPVQRQSVGQRAAFVRSLYGPRSSDRADLPAHRRQPTRRGTGVLEFWKADHRPRISVSQFPSFRVGSNGRTAVCDMGPACLPPPLTPRSAHSGRGGRPLNHAAGAGISSVMGRPGVPPAARGKRTGQAYSTAFSKRPSQYKQENEPPIGIFIGSESEGLSTDLERRLSGKTLVDYMDALFGPFLSNP